MARRPFIPVFLYLNAGLIIWFARFLFTYAFAAGACAHGWLAGSVWGIALVPLVLVAATIVATGAALPFLWRGLGPARRSETWPAFFDYIAASVAALAIVAMVWETIPVFTMPICS